MLVLWLINLLFLEATPLGQETSTYGIEQPCLKENRVEIDLENLLTDVGY